MKITYDQKIDAAYIYLVESISDGQAKKTYTCDPQEVNGEINLDFDEANKLIGIEILDASKKLPKKLLQKAEIISKEK